MAQNTPPKVNKINDNDNSNISMQVQTELEVPDQPEAKEAKDMVKTTPETTYKLPTRYLISKH